MKKFSNNKIVIIKDLKESGLYSDQLLDSLLSGNFEKLEELPIKKRAEIDYMEPLLYAVKNDPDLRTYKVFKYYAESLQNNERLVVEIMDNNEIYLIENTPISRNKEFMIEQAKRKPEVIQYMDSHLKVDKELISELRETGDSKIIEEIEKNCKISVLILSNPELSKDKEFMSEAIGQDVKYLENASEELKNDYEFIKVACNKNREAIDYISEHAEDFGNEGISAAKEVLVEETGTDAISEAETELEKINKKLEADTELKDDERKQLEIRKRQLNNTIKFINKIKEGKVNPERAIRLINSLCENLGEEYRQELMKYIKMDDALVERRKEAEGKEVTIEEVEEKTSGAKVGGIKDETEAIIKEDKKGEKENGDTHDTRA